MILRGNVYSRTLEMDTGIALWIPNDFEGERPYRCAYLLHGLCGSSGNWIDNTLLPVFARDYDVAFVMPEVGRSFYTDMKRGQRFFTYVADELPAICAHVFNISAERADTAVIGASMGGYGALKCALSRPERYGHCCALATACVYMGEMLERGRTAEGVAEYRAAYGEQSVTDFQAIFGDGLAWDAEDELLALAKRAQARGLLPRIYCACGTDDSLCAENRRFAGDMRALGAEVVYEERPGGHDWHYFNDELRRSLAFCFGGR